MMLGKGNKGSDVGNLQNDLVLLGFGKHLGKYGVDDHYGELTELAVKYFQRWVGIKVDGITGDVTEKHIKDRKNNAGSKGTYNFPIHEFRCKEMNTMLKNGMDDLLLLRLEKLRFMLGNNPVIINSGYRSKQHNENVGGATNSQHLYGKASDIKVMNKTPYEVYTVADAIFYNGGVSKYNTFVHVDTRGYRARW